MKRTPAMKRMEIKRIDVRRQDLARTLAARSPLSESQAQDELDRVVHDVITSLRRGLPAEMPGVGQMTARPVSAGSSRKSTEIGAKRTPSKTFLRKSAARQP